MNMSAKQLVYFEKWMNPIAEQTLCGRGDINLVRLEHRSPEEEIWAQLAAAHGYQIPPRSELAETWLVNADLLSRCPRLLAISSTGAGYDVVDVDACAAAGIIVCNQSGTNREAVAEHTLGLMLSLTKKIAVADRAMRRIPNLDRYAYTGNDLYGKTLGIVGIGHIGTRCAQLCGALFAMRVLAFDPYLTSEQIAERGAIKVAFDDLLRSCDFVSVHCPRTDETFGMIGRRQFAMMKPSAYFITAARGDIAGAAVDVFLYEPPALDHPLFAFENVIINRHIAGVTAESMYNMAMSAAEQWVTIFSGDIPPRLVNPQAWSRYVERFEDLLGLRPPPLT